MALCPIHLYFLFAHFHIFYEQQFDWELGGGHIKILLHKFYATLFLKHFDRKIQPIKMRKK